MKSYPRSERVGRSIQKEISEILNQGLRDPRVTAVTITDVDVSSDLKNARVFYIINGGKKEKREAGAGLESARGFIKRTLAATLKLKYMPEIRFYYDESLDYGEKIDRLLDNI